MPEHEEYGTVGTAGGPGATRPPAGGDPDALPSSPGAMPARPFPGVEGPPNGPERPRRLRFRAWQHTVSAVVAFAVLAIVLLAGYAVFSFVLVAFNDNGNGGIDATALLLGVLTTLAVALGLTLVTLLAGLLTDRLTRNAPLVVRLVVPVPLPVIGVAVLVRGPASVGIPVLVLGLAFLVHWATLLIQASVVHLVARSRQG